MQQYATIRLQITYQASNWTFTLHTWKFTMPIKVCVHKRVQWVKYHDTSKNQSYKEKKRGRSNKSETAPSATGIEPRFPPLNKLVRRLLALSKRFLFVFCSLVLVDWHLHTPQMVRWVRQINTATLINFHNNMGNKTQNYAKNLKLCSYFQVASWHCKLLKLIKPITIPDFHPHILNFSRNKLEKGKWKRWWNQKQSAIQNSNNLRELTKNLIEEDAFGLEARRWTLVELEHKLNQDCAVRKLPYEAVEERCKAQVEVAIETNFTRQVFWKPVCYK